MHIGLNNDHCVLGEISMAKHDSEKPLVVRCPNCKQMREPDLNETTHRYVCPVCAETLDLQVVIEKKKRGLKQ